MNTDRVMSSVSGSEAAKKMCEASLVHRKTLNRLWLLPMAVAALGVSACGSAPKYSSLEGAPHPAAVTEQDEQTVLRSRYDDANDTYANAAMSPLEDLNLRRQEIPTVLIRAEQEPYSLKGMETCAGIAAEVRHLDQVLGRDFDEAPPPAEDGTLTQRGQDAADDYAKGAVRGAARSLIPFRGVWRHLTGAEKHQKQVERSILAGKARRAYLKGVGMNKNCAPPAAPSWFKPRVYVDTAP
jgi:hypothetical protein